MALRGTLKDFGIADILQLIGHQGKTGVLTVRNRDQEVQLVFQGGSVVRAEAAARDRRELLGSILVRAEVVTPEQLGKALETQKKTLRRLGDILVESGHIDAETLAALAKLQTTETVYRLFVWDAGTYEFKQAEVVVDEHTEPIRCENILMEGFRQLDEWPAIRRRITAYEMRFRKLEDLDALTAEAASSSDGGDDDDFDLDGAFGDFEEGGSDNRLKNVGRNERIIYQLIRPERDVQKIIDLSRLGEFETCKALVTLMDASIIDAAAQKQRRPSATATVGGIHASQRRRWVQAVTRVALTGALIAAAVYGALSAGLSPRAWVQKQRGDNGYVQRVLQTELSRGPVASLRYALEVYRLEAGSYPERLDALVEAGLVSERDTRFPWHLPYHYARKGEGYVLLRPLY